MSNFFDHLSAINETKKNLIREDPETESGYVPFMINRGLSYFHDTVMWANEMNMHASIPKIWQSEFYLNGVSKKRRFSKWAKKPEASEDVNVIMAEYGYSMNRAMEVIDLFTAEQLKQLKEKHDTGGR
jgi:hypothetical protein